MDVRRMTTGAMCKERARLNCKAAEGILYGHARYGLTDDENMRLGELNDEIMRRHQKIRRDCAVALGAFA